MAVRVFVIDNYDSFTYNLVQIFAELGAEVIVARNDQITVEQIAAARPTHLVISPGPCTPYEAGISMAAIAHFGERLPVLGVCLGHQAIAEVCGGRVRRAASPVHGKTDVISHDGRGLFRGLPQPPGGDQIHSLIVDESCPRRSGSPPGTARASSWAWLTASCPSWACRFHPESVLTEAGPALL